MNGVKEIEGRWKPLEAHASTKIFFKGEWEGEPALLIRFEGGVREKEKFAAITARLCSEGIPVPPVVHDPGGPAIITKFIEGRLFSKIRVRTGTFPKILEACRSFNKIIPASLPEGYPLDHLDQARLRYELDFFLLHFCSSFLNEDPSEALKEAVHCLADEVGLFPAVFSHRDYHSENILATRDAIWIVDYQDALMAPRAYDLASLYVDGYRRPRTDERELLAERVEAGLGISRQEFRKTALQRALKALGTFGYQIIHRNKARYLESMALTSSYLEELASDETLPTGEAIDRIRSIKTKLT